MTIEQFLYNERNKDFKMENAFFKQIINETTITPQLILDSCILNRYDSIIRNFIVKLPITDKFRFKYQYNPKKLAFQEYENTDYWFLILYANELFSISQFSLDKNYIFMYQRGIQSVINEILNIEKYYIQKNSAHISQLKESLIKDN